MQHKKIAGVYLRISDDREGRELGVTRQREHCLELAEREGIQVYDIYNDNDRGASRYSTKPRKDYQRLLADARARRINTIIAYTTGRLTRRPREHEDQIDLAQDLGVQFYYVRSPSFDLNNSAGRRIARILASNDAGEADDISERVSDAKRKQASKGLYLGGYKAYGYEGPQYNEQGELVNRGRINVFLVDHEVDVIVVAVRRVHSQAESRCSIPLLSVARPYRVPRGAMTGYLAPGGVIDARPSWPSCVLPGSLDETTRGVGSDPVTPGHLAGRRLPERLRRSRGRTGSSRPTRPRQGRTTSR